MVGNNHGNEGDEGISELKHNVGSLEIGTSQLTDAETETELSPLMKKIENINQSSVHNLNCEEALINCKLVVVSNTGEVDFDGHLMYDDNPEEPHIDVMIDGKDGSLNHKLDGKSVSFIVDASDAVIDSKQVTSRILKSIFNNRLNVYSFRMRCMLLDPEYVDALVVPLVTGNPCDNLVELDLSYINLPIDTLVAIGKCLTISLVGYCPIKRLVLTRCGLGLRGARIIFEGITGNIFVEEVVLSANRVTDDAMAYLVKAFQDSQYRIRLLGLAGSELTVAGIRTIYTHLRTNQYLKELDLHDNPLGDEGADMFFRAIQDNRALTIVNLSHCKIKQCKWARRLREMVALATLNLSHNDIDDDGLEELSEAIEKCFCIRTLDLSSNAFGGKKAICMGKMLQMNVGLLSLTLSDNTFEDCVWEALGFGLRNNKTLQTLILLHCDITPAIENYLCEALSHNQVCTINMDFNDISAIARTNPRGATYKIAPLRPTAMGGVGALISDSTDSQTASGTASSTKRRRKKLIQPSTSSTNKEDSNSDPPVFAKALPISSEAAGLVLRESVHWRDRKIRELNASKNANQVLSKLGMDNWEEEIESQVGGEKGRDSSNAALLSSIMDNKEDDIFEGESITPSMESGPMSPHEAKVLRLRLARAEADRQASIFTQGNKILSVSYGYKLNGIGAITVDDSTTYHQAKELVKPLIETYLASANPNFLSSLLTDFLLLDPTGAAVTGPGTKLRTVWSEAGALDQILLIRPADWVSLPPKTQEEIDEEEDHKEL